MEKSYSNFLAPTVMSSMRLFILPSHQPKYLQQPRSLTRNCAQIPQAHVILVPKASEWLLFWTVLAPGDGGASERIRALGSRAAPLHGAARPEERAKS